MNFEEVIEKELEEFDAFYGKDEKYTGMIDKEIYDYVNR